MPAAGAAGRGRGRSRSSVGDASRSGGSVGRATGMSAGDRAASFMRNFTTIGMMANVLDAVVGPQDPSLTKRTQEENAARQQRRGGNAPRSAGTGALGAPATPNTTDTTLTALQRRKRATQRAASSTTASVSLLGGSTSSTTLLGL